MSEQGMSRQEINQGVQDFVVREKTMAKLKKAGLPQPPKPQDISDGVDIFGEWETLKKRHGGLSNIPHNVLGDFLDKWTGMVSYARWVEAVSDIDQATSREIRDTVKKQLYCLQEGGREIRDARVHVEPLYTEWEQKYTENLSMYIATKALREGYEHRANAISREITRRGNDMTDNRRSMNRGNQA